MPVNQTSHTRPILLSYEQAVGGGYTDHWDLRLPNYRNAYLSRYTPYCRYEHHRRFDCVDNAPAYNETIDAAGPPTHRAPVQPIAEPQPVDPGHAERVKTAIKEFFDLLAAFVAANNVEEEDIEHAVD